MVPRHFFTASIKEFIKQHLVAAKQAKSPQITENGGVICV